jgi:hypothetical protein
MYQWNKKRKAQQLKSPADASRRTDSYQSWIKPELEAGESTKHDVVNSGLRAEMDGGSNWVHEMPARQSTVYELPGSAVRDDHGLPPPPLPRDDMYGARYG